MFVSENKVMFPAGALVVVMDMRDCMQGFFVDTMTRLRVSLFILIVW